MPRTKQICDITQHDDGFEAHSAAGDAFLREAFANLDHDLTSWDMHRIADRARDAGLGVRE